MTVVANGGRRLKLGARGAILVGASLAAVSATGATTPGPPPAPAPASVAKLYDPASDPMFAEPYTDVDEWRDTPVRHRYVHGGFRGTDTRFSYYFPEKRAYQGRFFQYVTPVPDSETSAQAAKGGESFIGSSLDSGAYFVETNGGGAGGAAGPAFGGDPKVGAYKANAAAANYSRVLAGEMYGKGRPFGYVFGGSGGSLRTLGSVENTAVWDGSVPFVIASPVAIPNNFAVRMHAMRVLWDKFPGIVDAMDAGGSGNPYAGLNKEEADALREITRMGFPPQSWFGWKTMGVHAFTALYAGMLMADPTYFTDFWTNPGYLGFNPPESLKRARLQFKTSIRAPLSAEQAEAKGLDSGAIPGTARGSADQAWQAIAGAGGGARPVAFQLADVPPEVGFLGGDLVILSGQAKGKSVAIKQIVGDTALLGVADIKILAQLKGGDEVRVDNSNFLAAQTYHRHQVPGPEYPVFDQFRGPDGKPLYPQRRMQLGPLFAGAASGVVPNGKFGGKMIIVQSLWDREAFPWHADWYRKRAQAQLGAAADQRLRIWFTDHALHGGVEDPTRVISYVPILQQALRDLAAWVEEGAEPPASTSYQVEDGQVHVPATAGLRQGIQPVVSVRVNGRERIEVRRGDTVTLRGTIEVPKGTGSVIAAEWDLDGSGKFASSSPVPVGAQRTNVSTTFRFDKPGTYFPVLRGTSEREGNAQTPYRRIQNLSRARVVVR